MRTIALAILCAAALGAQMPVADQQVLVTRYCAGCHNDKLRSGGFSWSTVNLAHPEKDRPLSIEEYKRIQEFPDDWKICGSLIDQYKQVGNAVPISLGKAIGLAIISHSQKTKSVDTISFQYSRYKFTDDVSWEMQVRMNLKQHMSNLKKPTIQQSLFA